MQLALNLACFLHLEPRNTTMSHIFGHSLRQLRFLVFVLAASNLILGAISAYFLYDNDNAYTLLFDRHVPVLGKTLRLVERTSTLQRNVVNSHLLPGALERTEATRKVPALRLEVGHLAREVSGDLKQFGNMELGNELDRRYDAYFGSLEKCASLPPDRIVQLHEAPLSESRALLGDIHVAIEKSNTWLEQKFQSLSDELTDRTQRKVTILGGLALWPLLVVVVVLALAVSLVSFFLLVNRHPATASEP